MSFQAEFTSLDPPFKTHPHHVLVVHSWCCIGLKHSFWRWESISPLDEISPSRSHDHMTWGTPSPPGSLTQDWAPALEDWRTSSLTSPALLPRAGNRKRSWCLSSFNLLLIPFLPHWGHPWGLALFSGVQSLNLSLQSLEEDFRVQSKQKDECLLWGSFIILSLVMTGEEKGFAHKL